MKLPEINMDILESAYINAVLVEAGDEDFGSHGESLEDRAQSAFHAWIDDLEEKAEERGSDGGYEDGVTDGYGDGYNDGYSDGRAEGHEAGYEEGFKDGGAE